MRYRLRPPALPAPAADPVAAALAALAARPPEAPATLRALVFRHRAAIGAARRAGHSWPEIAAALRAAGVEAAPSTIRKYWVSGRARR